MLQLFLLGFILGKLQESRSTNNFLQGVVVAAVGTASWIKFVSSKPEMAMQLFLAFRCLGTTAIDRVGPDARSAGSS